MITNMIIFSSSDTQQSKTSVTLGIIVTIHNELKRGKTVIWGENALFASKATFFEIPKCVWVRVVALHDYLKD